MEFPDEFVHQMRGILGEKEAAQFFASFNQDVSVSAHKHPVKKVETENDFSFVPWNQNSGRYLSQRSTFTLDPVFHAGAYYVQEASSMFIAEIFRQLFEPEKPLRVLDLCAAPGGKSTLIAGMLNERSWLLANEVIQSRYSVLVQNIVKWGLPNVFTANHDPEDFRKLQDYFDLVMVDAPCSGEGLFRKDLAAQSEWSPEAVQHCSVRQKRILAAAMNLIKPGGFLIYSTCTYNNFENGDNCQFVLQKTDFQQVKLKIPTEWGIVEKENTFQFFPHRVKGEGFFAAVFQRRDGNFQPSLISRNGTFRHLQPLSKKLLPTIAPFIKQPENFSFFQTSKAQVRAIPVAYLEDVFLLDSVLQRKQFGIEIGEMKGEVFIPSHDLALSTIIPADLPGVELDREQALIFLKKEAPKIETDRAGWLLARYKGLNLGWLKVLPSRINNYLPTNWRIRMDIEKRR